MRIKALFSAIILVCSLSVWAQNQEPPIEENELEQQDTLQNENGQQPDDQGDGAQEPAEENGTTAPQQDGGVCPQCGMPYPRGQRGMMMMGICPVHTLQPQVLPAQDGGIIVVIGNKLIKYNSELAIQQETTVELDKEEIETLIRQRMEVMQMCRDIMKEMMPQEGEENGPPEENGEPGQDGMNGEPGQDGMDGQDESGGPEESGETEQNGQPE